MDNIFVGNLSFQATKEDLKKLFEPFGAVVHTVIVEQKKGKSRGFGFVDMPNEEEKNKAIAALQDKEFMGRKLLVTVVVPKVKIDKPRKFRSKFTKRDEQGESRSFGNSQSESKPWVKSERSSRPSDNARYPKKTYRRDDRESKPWVKKEGGRPSGNPQNAGRPYRSDGKRSAEKPYRQDGRESKPWVKREGDPRSAGNPRHEGKPYHRADRESKPWAKSEGGAKPYRRDDRESKPWSQNKGTSKPPYKKFDGPSRPRGKSEGASKPLSKTGGGFKMFYKKDKPSHKREQ